MEVLGIPENYYWSYDEVTLAVVISCPPTEEEVKKRMEHYIATHEGFDVCDHHLSYEFGQDLDNYLVVSPYFDGIDRSPTIATLKPSLPISPQRRSAMKRLYEKYKNAER